MTLAGLSPAGALLVRAGEPFVLRIILTDAQGAPQDLTGRSFAVAFRRSNQVAPFLTVAAELSGDAKAADAFGAAEQASSIFDAGQSHALSYDIVEVTGGASITRWTERVAVAEGPEFPSDIVPVIADLPASVAALQAQAIVVTERGAQGYGAERRLWDAGLIDEPTVAAMDERYLRAGAEGAAPYAEAAEAAQQQTEALRDETQLVRDDTLLARDAAHDSQGYVEAAAQTIATTVVGTPFATPAAGAAVTPNGQQFVAYNPPDSWLVRYLMVAGVPIPQDDVASGNALRRVGDLVPLIGNLSKARVDSNGVFQTMTRRNGGARYALLGSTMLRADVSGIDTAGLRTDLIGEVSALRGMVPRYGNAVALRTDSTGRPMQEHRANGGAYLADGDVMRRIGEASGAAANGVATLILAGEGALSHIETDLNGYALQRWFGPFNTLPDNETLRWLFNPDADIIDGVTIRSSRDDATPDHIFSTTIGANHSWVASIMTAAGHGKTAADVGSVWTRTGHDYVLTRVRDANTLLMTSRDTNGAVPFGTFTHVSGATNTGSITASASTAGNWSPPAQDMEMRVLVDGELVCVSRNGVLVDGAYEGRFSYRDSVQFIETYDVLSKAELTNWIEGHPASLYPTGRAPSLRITNVYEYDRWGGLTLYRDWLFLAEVPVADLMGLQLNAAAAFDPATADYYIPNTTPFTYAGGPVDYANFERANLTIAAPGQASVWFDSSNIEPTGPYLMRALALYDSGYVDAAGFLPIADAADDVRRDRCSVRAMEIRGNTGKRYFRVVHKGAFTAQAGDHFAVVGYRHVFPKSNDRTALYTVRSREADYVFADWHGQAGIDTLDLPQDLIGRPFTISASRNASALGAIIAGRLSVNVAAAGDYAFLILRVAK